MLWWVNILVSDYFWEKLLVHFCLVWPVRGNNNQDLKGFTVSKCWGIIDLQISLILVFLNSLIAIVFFFPSLSSLSLPSFFPLPPFLSLRLLGSEDNDSDTTMIYNFAYKASSVLFPPFYRPCKSGMSKEKKSNGRSLCLRNLELCRL